MMLVAVAAFSLSAGVAYAESEGGPVANTQFTQLPGYLAQAPVQNAPPVVAAQNGQGVHVYSAPSAHGTRLFPPHEGNG
jgi:hypothetical protein